MQERGLTVCTTINFRLTIFVVLLKINGRLLESRIKIQTLHDFFQFFGRFDDASLQLKGNESIENEMNRLRMK